MGVLGLGFGQVQSQKQQQTLTHRLFLSPEFRQAAIPLMISDITALDELIRKELVENPELKVVGEDDSIEWPCQSSSFEKRPTRKDHWAEFDSSYYENTLEEQVSLQGLLLKELKQSFLSERDQEIGYALIKRIDEDGFVGDCLAEIADEMEVEASDVERVLHVVQESAPVGVAARDLQECYLLQLEHFGKTEGFSFVLVKDFWGDLLQRKISRICRETGRSEEEVLAAMNEVAKLDRHPANSFDSAEELVVPEAYIYKAENGNWKIRLNNGSLPELYVNQECDDSHSGEECVRFFNDLRSKASSFMLMLQYRNKTILKVISAILRAQKDFFELGEEYLRPLTQSVIAQEAEISEATMSRMVSSKYVHTPRGVFSLKHFFDSGVECKQGGKIAAKAVKAKIHKLVSMEDRRKPFSDQNLTDQLVADGVMISCRGVNKYRQDILIGSTRERKWA